MYNIFVAGNGQFKHFALKSELASYAAIDDLVVLVGSAAWEWLPDFYSGNAKEGGNLFVVSACFSLTLDAQLTRS